MVASAPQSQSQSQPLSAEEEALKSNTDCVYFLASPLTCKKGSECEYRHSDIARVNPRDCWYWLHGNCLNPKCAFRHPPLDGLLGAQTPTSTGPSVPVSQTVAAPAPAPHVPNAPTKQGVPCVFFQKGYCLKGDWCPFLHTPISSSTKALPVPGTAFSAEPANIKKPVAAIEKTVQQNVIPITAAKSVIKDTPGTKLPIQRESAPPRNEFSMNRRAPQTSGITEFSGHRSAPHVSNGNLVSWSSRAQPPHQLEDPESMTSKDADEVSREPSPGFDVLVDDEGRDSDFYTGEDRYGMSREQHDPEYDIDHPNDDYNMIAAVDDERYHDRLGFDSHEHRKGQYGWEQHRASSGGSYRERRPYSRVDNLGQVDESDLRHRLVKHNKPNGLRSVINREHARDIQVGDRSYQGSRRDEHRISSRENSVGSRLRGRIRLPQRSSSPNNRDMIRSSDRGDRVQTSIPSHPGRIQDRIKGRVEEAYNDGGKNYRGLHSRRDVFGDNNVDFAAPKSLAELKNRKNAEPGTDQQSSLGKRKHLILDGHQNSEKLVSFEGPKPLEEILKRKKRGTSSNNEEIVEEKNREGETKNETSKTLEEDIERDESKPKAEDSVLGEDGKLEPYEHGESDYEQGGEDYELYDGENGEAEGEYVEEEEEEDDDDDFAKKMGVVYS
ncbi:hypothetical protein ACS0TY_011303 [Phlomoides rotata]